MARYAVGLETRERILRATRELLAEVGFEGATLKAITGRADVGSGSFYNLFESKDDAIFEVVREAIEAIDPAPEKDNEDTLEDLLEAFLSFMTDMSPIARIYLQLAGYALTDDAIAVRLLRSHQHRVLRFADAWRRAVPGLSASEAHRRAETTLAAMTGLGLIGLLDPHFDVVAHVRALPSSHPTAEQA